MTSVVDVRATNDPKWADVLSRHASSLFHSPDWLGVIEQTYGFEVRALVYEELDTAVAGIPYVAIDDLRGQRVVCVPFSDYCDPLYATDNQWDTLCKGLLATGNDVRLRTVHADLPDEDAGFERSADAAWHAIDISGDIEEQWAGVSASARRAVRKARSEGVTIRRGESSADLRRFFELHLRTRKAKYRLLAQPYAFFENIWKAFVERGRGSLVLASVDGVDVAGVLFLDDGTTRYYKFNASDPSATGVRPNDLILWTSIEDATADGIERIDLGQSEWSQEGLLRYKRKYATTEGSIVYRRSRFAAQPPSGPGEALGTMTELLTEASIPDEVTEAAGASLYRYFA